MKSYLFGPLLVLCLSASLALAQTGASNATATATSGQTAQSGAASSSQPQAANSNASATSDADVQAKIQDAMKNDPMLSNVKLDKIKVNVTPDKVELKGNVNNKQEKENMVRLSQSFAEGRKVEDQLTERPAGKGGLANAPTSATPGGSATGNNSDTEKREKK